MVVEIYLDDQDPNNTGLAYRLYDGDHEESGSIDSISELAEVLNQGRLKGRSMSAGKALAYLIDNKNI